MKMYNNGVVSHLNLNPFILPPYHSRFPPRPPQICCCYHFSRIPNHHRLYTPICCTSSYRPPQPHLFFRNYPCTSGKRRGSSTFMTRAAARRESPYQVLGLSPSATPDDIKRAYRKMALKYHPDVNKQPDAQEKFMRIKHAYNTLIDSKSRGKYDQYARSSDYSYTQRNRTTRQEEEEDFYGLGDFVRDFQLTLADFFRDVQEEFCNWEASASSQGKPKSLWEELSEIGEEFVEFLEKELSIGDSEDKPEYSCEGSHKGNKYRPDTGGYDMKNEASKDSSIEDNIDEIEATLAQLKRELGL